MEDPQRLRPNPRGPEELEQRITVEVGCGPRSLLADAPVGYLRRFKGDPNSHYVAVDVNSGYVDEAEGTLADSVGEILGDAIGRVSFRNTSGSELTFLGNSTVAEVICKNVFGEPRVSEEIKQGILRESLRVLRPGGTLTIVESITPQVLARHHVLQYGTMLFGSEPTTSDEIVGQGIFPDSIHGQVAVFKKAPEQKNQ